LAAAVSALAAAPAGTAGRVKLPADWTVGSQHRYRAIWSRSIDVWRAPGSPPPSMNTEQRGEIAIRVTGKSKEGYLLRWEPTISTSYPPRAKGDVDAAGAELWRLGLSLPLDLTVDPVSPGLPVVRNAREVHERVVAQMQAFVRELPGQAALDCAGADASSFACQTIGTESANIQMVLRSTAPLFRCAGLDLDVRNAESWSETHPSPEIGAAVSIENRREVVGYEARSPHVRVKTTSQPNAAQLQAWIKGKVASMPESDKGIMEKVFAQMSFRFETDCTMDRRSGWPVSVEFKTVGGAALYQGSEVVQFERIEP
jgi:hypothetical protein